MRARRRLSAARAARCRADAGALFQASRRPHGRRTVRTVRIVHRRLVDRLARTGRRFVERRRGLLVLRRDRRRRGLPRAAPPAGHEQIAQLAVRLGQAPLDVQQRELVRPDRFLLVAFRSRIRLFVLKRLERFFLELGSDEADGLIASDPDRLALSVVSIV